MNRLSSKFSAVQHADSALQRKVSNATSAPAWQVAGGTRMLQGQFAIAIGETFPRNLQKCETNDGSL